METLCRFLDLDLSDPCVRQAAMQALCAHCATYMRQPDAYALKNRTACFRAVSAEKGVYALGPAGGDGYFWFAKKPPGLMCAFVLADFEATEEGLVRAALQELRTHGHLRYSAR